MKKTILFTLLGLVVGVVIGGIATTAYNGSVLAEVIFMMQEKEFVEMEDTATKAYYDQPAEVAIWAFENYIRKLEVLEEEQTFDETGFRYFILAPERSLVYSHARLGVLYKKLNNTEKSEYHFQQAISKGKKTNLPAFATKEKLIEFIYKIDSARNSIDKENQGLLN